MTLADIDWGVLRPSLIVLLVAVVLGGTVVATAEYYSAGVYRDHRAESRRLTSARRKYLTLDDEKRLIQEFYPQYQDLESQGAIGNERRLAWIESLRSIAARQKLPALRYEVSTQQPFEPDFPVDTGRYESFVSDMRLDIGLLHEEDLVTVFERLRAQAPGVFTVRNCQVQRAREAFVDDPTEANLTATCMLRWITVRLGEVKETRSRRRRRR